MEFQGTVLSRVARIALFALAFGVAGCRKHNVPTPIVDATSAFSLDRWILLDQPSSNHLVGLGHSGGGVIDSTCYRHSGIVMSAGINRYKYVVERRLSTAAQVSLAKLFGLDFDDTRVAGYILTIDSVTVAQTVNPHIGPCTIEKDGTPSILLRSAALGAKSLSIEAFDSKSRRVSVKDGFLSISKRVGAFGGKTESKAKDSIYISFDSHRWFAERRLGFKLSPSESKTVVGPAQFGAQVSIAGSPWQIRIDRHNHGDSAKVRIVLASDFGRTREWVVENGRRLDLTDAKGSESTSSRTQTFTSTRLLAAASGSLS